MTDLDSIRVFHDGPSHHSQGIAHTLAMHYGQGRTKDHQVEITASSLEYIKEEIDRLHVIEQEHRAMESQLKALRLDRPL